MEEIPRPASKEQKSTRQIELRKLLFQVKSIIETVGEIICKVTDSLNCHGCFLKFEVKGSSDEWVLVFSLELR